MKQKLLIIMDTIRPMVDGVSTFLDRLLPYFSEKYDVTVIAPNYGEKNYPGIKIIKYPVIRYDEESYGLPVVKRKIVKDQVKKCDIVFSNESISPFPTHSLFAARYARIYDKPMFTYIHSIDWELFPALYDFLPSFFRHMLNKILIIFGDWFLNNQTAAVVSFPTIAEIMKKNNIKPNFEFAPIGITSIFKPDDKVHERFSDKIVLGYVGRVSVEKGLKVLLDVFRDLKKKYENLFLLIVGDGPDRNIFEKQKDVEVTGFIDYEKVPGFFDDMDFFVLPSYTEANSLSTLEAMKSGVCCITRDVGAIKDYIKNGENGFLFQKDSELENILEKLIEDKKLRKNIGDNAYESVKKFTWENTSDSLIRIFEKYQKKD